ncbi:cellulose biosynthesis protein BcsP [Paraburkholderia phenoliruptrix]|uniref:Cellulose biosynthesis protein BcsR n=2 Tax=Paraburkholderia phenoliruptrix TaxID=252970 RepID=K0DXD0_9BURK|nr:cellulose biosynthesis protein BcsP [Paraburkholderia phenoliruptrix]AFT89332.1 hypothetical protein BUPH_06553 [Paraburkholderia phenoliruptrix BR3459a]CAB4050727.1 hypothetical protein LMG9964_04394 [Paraburkholderia phenoliruptrix]
MTGARERVSGEWGLRRRLCIRTDNRGPGQAGHDKNGGIMSSSSDIEKLFDHFGGDANAYQEIGRENEAHTARTRWPLLVTLDLRQPSIPAIGPHGQQPATAHAAEHEPAAASSTAERDEAAPKDVASVLRAKAPLFTRSPRRDIPPVVVPAPPPVVPRGAGRFGAAETAGKVATTSAAGLEKAVPPVVGAAAVAAVPPVPPDVAPIHKPMFAPAAVPAPAPQSGSILGKLFNRQPEPTQPRASASGAAAAEPVALQSLFDRLRGTPRGAAGQAAPNSWLVNGPRRS